MKVKGSAVFQIFLIFMSVVFYFVSWGYNPRARLAPEIFSFVLFVLIGGLFLGENVPAFRKYARFLNQRGFFTDKEKSKQSSKEESVQVKSEDNKQLVLLLLWLAALIVALRFVSYLIVVPVWLLLFMRFQSRRTWRNAVYSAVGMGIFNFVLFNLLLKATF